MDNYKIFLKEFDKKLENYFNQHKEYVHCKIGCSHCCENGDYPLSQLELEYLMQGYIKLDNDTKIKVQKNIKSRPQTSDGSGINNQINKDIKTPLGSNIQNSGQNFNQGPTGFKDNHIEPQTNPANPFNTPQTMTEPTLPE